jgi:hypothetical protein
MKKCIGCGQIKSSWEFFRLPETVGKEFRTKDGRQLRCGVCEKGWIGSIQGEKQHKVIWMPGASPGCDLPRGLQIGLMAVERYGRVGWVTDGKEVWRWKDGARKMEWQGWVEKMKGGWEVAG